MSEKEYIDLYNIKVQTTDNKEFEYKEKPLEETEKIIEEHPDYNLIHAVYVKRLVKTKRNV